jgi:hypothetical protein
LRDIGVAQRVGYLEFEDHLAGDNQVGELNAE